MRGLRMRFTIPQKDGTKLNIKLAPLTDIDPIADGLQDMRVSRFYGFEGVAPTVESLSEIYDKKTTVAWGIHGANKLIGTTMFHGITEPVGMTRGLLAILIFDRGFWGKGVASYVNMATTWYAFSEYRLWLLKAHVANYNTASRKAIEKCGYRRIGEDRNVGFTGGELWHNDIFECLNPLENHWRIWWGSDEPPEEAITARQKSLAAIRWAEENKINR